MTVTVLVTDSALGVVGDPLPWTDLDITLRFNEPGSGVVDCPATPAVMAQLAGGNRITVIRDGTVLIAGPYEADEYEWETGSDPGSVSIQFVQDLALICGRITYPNPSLVAYDDTQPAYWTVTATAAGTAMLALVDTNAGPGALAARQIPALTIGAGTGLGASVDYRSRWAPLGDELRALAVAGGGLGFRTTETSGAVVFEVHEPTDRSTGVGAVRYSRGLGNLRKVKRKRQAPTTTAVIIGGPGALADRAIRERINTTGVADWWRVETFTDQQGTDSITELDQAGDTLLTEGAETVSLEISTLDTEDQRYGTHYGLGDKVAVEPVPGYQVADLVRSVHITISAETGEQITSTVGSLAATPEPEWVRQMRALDRRLGRLETR